MGDYGQEDWLVNMLESERAVDPEAAAPAGSTSMRRGKDFSSAPSRTKASYPRSGVLRSCSYRGGKRSSVIPTAPTVDSVTRIPSSSLLRTQAPTPP